MTGSTEEGLSGVPSVGIRQRRIGRNCRVPHGALVRLERSAGKVHSLRSEGGRAGVTPSGYPAAINTVRSSKGPTQEDNMYSKTARYYDKIYSSKDYRAEVQHFTAIVRENLRSGGNRLLDVACGTGRHIEYLKENFDVEGLDICQELLEIACQRNPDISFHHADMTEFDLGREFDIVTCLFSSIGYVKTLHNLTRAVTCMTRHVKSGGILVIEPWFTPDSWQPGSLDARFVDEPELKIARITTCLADGRLSYFDAHFLIGTPEGTEHIIEHHELGLFDTDEIRVVLADVGLEVAYDVRGLAGRGMFIGRRSLL